MEGRDLTGTTIAGKYLVKRAIGAGGMGAVYEGQHVEIGKRVAIKVIASEHARSDELAARFRREARAASAVESEHIVHVFDVGQDESAGLYMVMEMLSGTDVATRIERAGGALPLDEAITIIQQAARGLAKAHAAGVVHRDLKPANLFLTTREDGTPCVKILDFGISKLVRRENDGGKQSSLTREGVVIGTPQYMSPEQAQGLAVDHRTDIWSLGAVAYEILSGQPAFAPRDTYEQMIVQIVTTKPRPLREVAPHVPAEIAALVDATLVSDLATRLPDATTLAKGLAGGARLPSSSSPDFAHAATVAAAPVTPVALPMKTSDGVVVQAQTSPGKSKMPIAIVAAVAAVLLVGGLGVAMSKRPPDPPPATGIVAPPPPPPSPAVTSAEPVAKLAPLTPIAEPSASASASPILKIPSKPIAVPPVRPVATVSAKPAAPSGQYGAAGVSTAY